MFMEYARNAVRMAALMQQRSIFVYTHDSIGLGEDGPTHQPVEQMTSLRSDRSAECFSPGDTGIVDELRRRIRSMGADADSGGTGV